MELRAQSDSQAQVQIMKILYVFIVVLAILHLYLMEENSLGHFYNLLTASVQDNLFKGVCIANSLGR